MDAACRTGRAFQGTGVRARVAGARTRVAGARIRVAGVRIRVAGACARVLRGARIAGSPPFPILVLFLRSVLLSFLLAFLLSACGLNRSEPSAEEDVPHPTIEEVQERHTPAWMEIPGVVGTGIGLCDDEPCIRVFLAAPSPEAEKAIPKEVEGYRVEVVVTGPFRPRGPGG